LDDARCKAVACSPGVDLVPVFGHALATRRRRIVRDIVLLGVLGATLALSAVSPAGVALGVAAAFAVTFSFAWRGYRAVRRLRREDFDPAAEPAAINEHAQAL